MHIKKKYDGCSEIKWRCYISADHLPFVLADTRNVIDFVAVHWMLLRKVMALRQQGVGAVISLPSPWDIRQLWIILKGKEHWFCSRLLKVKAFDSLKHVVKVSLWVNFYHTLYVLAGKKDKAKSTKRFFLLLFFPVFGTPSSAKRYSIDMLMHFASLGQKLSCVMLPQSKSILHHTMT